VCRAMDGRVDVYLWLSVICLLTLGFTYIVLSV
jgi:hypothetical protein